MDNRKLRKSIPLKIAAHMIMAASTAALIICVVLFAVFMDVRANRNGTADFTKSQEEPYFSSQMFINKYGEALDRLLPGINAANSGSGYPLEFYMSGYVNFKYAVYDLEGKILYASDGWSDALFKSADKKYYYTIDIHDLQLFGVEDIRYANYSTTFYTDEEGREIDDPYDYYEGSGSGGITRRVVNGTITYGSNFLRYTSFYRFDDSELAANTGYICTYVPDKLVQGDTFYDSYYYFQKWSRFGKWSIIGGAAAIIIIIICFSYLLVSAGYTKSQEGIRLQPFDRLYSEIAASLICMGAVMPLAIFIDGYGDFWEPSYLLRVLCGAIPSYIIGMYGIFSFARRAKAHTVISNSIIYKLLYGIYEFITKGLMKRSILRKYVAVILAMGIADVIFVFIAVSSQSASIIFCLIILLAFEFVFIGRKLIIIQDIKKGAKEIASGNLEYKIDSSKMSGLFKEFAEDINNIGKGLNVAVDESIKSERMKADLITNVSHDIKTPLTSIINYVDLLKRQNITEEPSHEYIEILDTKSQRLKALIEDLVEASRASSGNIVLEKSKINFVELVIQVAGTYQEKYETRQLEIVVKPEIDEMMVMADGRRLYRVLDNLFNNAFKYSMASSRIYIDMYPRGDKACFIMKNISEAPLNISAEELSQRFVRGDESRTTEGSGLGLSIARSLIELHGGQFDIYLDGDLFKTTIILDLAEEEPEAEQPGQ